MTFEEACAKADEALELEVIELHQYDAYVEYLMEKSKDV